MGILWYCIWCSTVIKKDQVSNPSLLYAGATQWKVKKVNLAHWCYPECISNVVISYCMWKVHNENRLFSWIHTYIYVCIYIRITFFALFLLAFLAHFLIISIAKQKVFNRTIRRRFTGFSSFEPSGCRADASPAVTKAVLTGMPPLRITA